ncbi:MAG TPA: histone deacetylase [Candidatus Krumholzibacteria bacterium]|nr:histone deacetylase [Candidatus Krumholzibacteria bacterium]
MNTGFFTDATFLRHHNPDGHPERVERLEAMLRLASRCGEFGVTQLPVTRRATHDELARVHSREHIGKIAATAGRDFVMLDPDTFTSPDSYDCALLAAGGALDAVDRVMSGELDNAFVAARPPGHHAESRRAMGFCLFSNIAVAAAHARAAHRLERVMIIDWDVHHGNGTQEIFWNDGRVLFVSLHQFPFYPGTGAFEEMGGPDAVGMTVNIPLAGGFGDEEWIAAFRRVVMPLGDQFMPELVLLSAGFDAHVDDPLGGMRVTESGFAAMADAVLTIANTHAKGKLVALLEGGYNIAALEASVEHVLRRMSGENKPTEPPLSEGRFAPVHAMLRAVHAGHWKL